MKRLFFWLVLLISGYVTQATQATDLPLSAIQDAAKEYERCILRTALEVSRSDKTASALANLKARCGEHLGKFVAEQMRVGVPRPAAVQAAERLRRNTNVAVGSVLIAVAAMNEGARPHQ